jgi:beta-mannosidase
MAAEPGGPRMPLWFDQETKSAGQDMPPHQVVREFNEFELCELDLKSLKQLSDCVPARVPGDVFTALMEAGRIEDPYRDLNSLEAQWVDERAWLYKTSFHYAPETGRRAHLLFMGLDYISRIELNGKVLVPRHEGMFSRVDLDITDSLSPSGEQELSVILFGVPGTSMEWLGPVLESSEFGRRNYLKTQMSFGWDFAPRLKGAGIWDRAFLYETGPIKIRDIFVRTKNDGYVNVTVELEEPAEMDATVFFGLWEYDPVKFPVLIAAPIKKGERFLSWAYNLENPKLWWPWDMGDQNIYVATALVKVDGEFSDEVSEFFGFREISWGPNPDAPPGSADWVLFVNGKREFIRGANWVPPESMYGRMDDTRYEKLITMAKDMGANCLRIWGGGNRERRAFYDYCDRHGVMVWQEFPFACVYLMGYPKTERFRNLVRQEADEMVRQLRNHPSIIMWCGGNEFNVNKARHVVDILEDVTSSLDPTRRFIPASPYKGDTHNWTVWHMKGNLDDYFSDVSPLPSEFGLQGFANPSTLEKWISPQYLWPINEVHEHHDLGRGKMDKYVSAIGHDDTLESYAEASQLMQAHYLQRGIENWRQRKYKTSGTAFWQLNEPWPAICWSVIDYELQPKLSYHVLKNTYNPVLVTAKYEDRRWGPGDAFKAKIMVVNDLHREYRDAEVSAVLCGEQLGEWQVDVPEDDVISVATIESEIPKDCGLPSLSLYLAQKKPVSQNQYSLWVHDPVPAGKVNATLERIGKRIMSGAWQPKPEP